jgi:hypothetical protein
MLRHGIELLVSGFFGVWFLLCLLVLVPRLRPYIRAWDIFSLVPEWKFFAPNPAQGDYILLYRDQLANGSITQWTEVSLAQKRRWWNVVWNPGKRANKALFDAVVEVSSEASLYPEILAGSIAYLTLLNYVSNLGRFARPAFTQFMILHSFSSTVKREPRLIFSSSLHSL